MADDNTQELEKVRKESQNDPLRGAAGRSGGGGADGGALGRMQKVARGDDSSGGMLSAMDKLRKRAQGKSRS